MVEGVVWVGETSWLDDLTCVCRLLGRMKEASRLRLGATGSCENARDSCEVSSMCLCPYVDGRYTRVRWWRNSVRDSFLCASLSSVGRAKARYRQSLMLFRKLSMRPSNVRSEDVRGSRAEV